MEENKTKLLMYKCQFDEERHMWLGVVAESEEDAENCKTLKDLREQENVTVNDPIDFNQLNLLELFPIYLADDTKTYNLAFGYHLEETEPPKPEMLEVGVSDKIVENEAVNEN